MNLGRFQIVDDAVLYGCTYQRTAHILVSRNCLHASSMTNNMIPLFFMQEAGVVVSEQSKLHFDEPEVDATESNDTSLHVAMANIVGDTGPTGKEEN